MFFLLSTSDLLGLFCRKMSSTVTSFKKNVKHKIPRISGTKPSLQNAQLLVSSGIPSLDTIIGGGLPVGTIFLLEEDIYGNYAKILVKYFLSEGIVSGHDILVASQDLNSEQLIAEIPSPIESDLSASTGKNDQEDEMKIAWRYKNLPTVESSYTQSDFGHNFDLTKPIDQEILNKCNISHWHFDDNLQHKGSFSNVAYENLLYFIKEKLQSGQFFINSQTEHKGILRLAIHSLGSPLWLAEDEYNSNNDLTLFLYILRSLFRSTYAVCMITVPSHLFKDVSLIKKIEHLCDISIKLESFKGSDKETNPVFRDYHGLLFVNKIAAINTLTSHIPECSDLAFKLRRRKITIEKLHLPPELQESAQREQDDFYSSSSQSCGGTGRKQLLDF